MVGRKGMLGARLALGVAKVPMHALVQGAGAARRIATADFRRELARSTALQRGLNRYVYVLMSQWAAAAACLRSARKRSGLIEYRGDQTVLDRPGLEAMACNRYATNRQAYAELLP